MADAAAAGRQPVQIWHCGIAAHRHLAKAEAASCLERRAEGAADDGAENDVDYADPGYQADGQKRYPIDSEGHIRAAWAYIHQPDNAARYTEAQLAHVKARIRAAWQDKIDPAGPPGDGIGGKGMLPASLGKGAGELGRIGQIIGDLDWLCGFLRGMMEAGIAAAPPDPAAWRGKTAETGDLAKALAGEILPRLDSLARRVEDIAATPLPAQAAARGYAGISKREDGAGPDGDVVAALSRMSSEERTLALIKAAHANPIRPAGSAGL